MSAESVVDLRRNTQPVWLFVGDQSVAKVASGIDLDALPFAEIA
jgi:hypothetical protein